MDIHIIAIDWDIIPFKEVEIAKLKESYDQGVYQIYGNHPAYGFDSLLYIGQASNFANRLHSRDEFLESSAYPQHIRFGRVCNNSKAKNELDWSEADLPQLINITEQILIRSHTPAFNKQHNSGLFNEEGIMFKGSYQHFTILNLGNYGKLLPETSTLRYSYKFYMNDLPVGYKK